MNVQEILIWSGLAIGLAFGATGQYSGFCLNRAFKEYWQSGALHKAQSFVLALGVAIIGTQALAHFEMIDLSKSIYRGPTFSWLLVFVGGGLFGYGMMLANGCGARTLVLCAQGNLRSLVVLLCLGISAYMTLTGVFGPLRMVLAQTTAVSGGSIADLPVIAQGWVVSLLLLGLFAFSFWKLNLLRHKRDLFAGFVMGLLIVAGWFSTGWLAFDEFEPVNLVSLTFVAPIGETIQYAMIATGMKLSFGVSAVLGVLLGSFLIAWLRKGLHLQGFSSPREMLRYIVGGVSMGVGGSLALGCSIGQGLTGLSTLALSSVVAVAGILLGARLGFHRSR
ncbi:YeeE/YedE family protein [Zwartia vadi]|uniref:YeeE/YedE family protein n=1 Tax=Zwartia vadi TaxID=3058168 RepID=UPI0025B347D5|nr:YeeE/YedE family protein [Zwartia vadi]MDN3988338.1 YeeE/YedE family protein [Zwartia vadi]